MLATNVTRSERKLIFLIGEQTMIELDAMGVSRKPDLKHFFVECSKCGYDLRFDYYDQKRNCPECNELVYLSEEIQEYLRKEKRETLQWLEVIREQMGKTEA